MNKFVFVFAFLVLFSMAGVMAVPETGVSYFYQTSCPHCVNVLESGILEKVGALENVSVEKFETTSPFARDKYLDYLDELGIPLKEAGIPFLVVEQNGEISYLMGDVPIIEDLEDSVVNFRPMTGGSISKPFIGRLTLGVVVVSALIDSINPCAFGVLLFLMAVILSMGSNKRALRSGITYILVIFFVYLAAGLGIIKIIGAFDVLDNVKIIAGIIVMLGALIELKDFAWEGKGFSLKIPVSAKPMLEKYVRKGTLPALVVLGALVALVELPCTGGIYLAILSLIADSGIIGMFYLVLYNLIFVLPLVLITFMIYHGAKVDVVNDWVQKNKRFMRLAAGLIMIFLALTLLGVL